MIIEVTPEENIDFLKSLCDFGMNLIFEINKFQKKKKQIWI